MITPILPKPITYKGKQLYRQAWEWGKEKYPTAPIEQHYAFASSVLDLVRNEVDYQDMGPSCRCHAVSIAAAGDGEIKHLTPDLYAVFPDGRMRVLGRWEFEQACRFAEPYCYGNLTALHIRCYKNLPCFDEAPEDLEKLKKHSS